MFVLFHSEITTSSVLATFKIQATLDGTNWKDIPKPESTSSLGFATATGTGSPVNTDVCIEVPPGVAANVASIRAVCTLSGASTAAADKTSASIYWLRFGSISS
jgi:hypothetical protein